MAEFKGTITPGTGPENISTFEGTVTTANSGLTGLAAAENDLSNWATAVTVVTGPFMVTEMHGTWIYRHNGDVATIVANGATRLYLSEGVNLTNTVKPDTTAKMDANVGLVCGFYIRLA